MSKVILEHCFCRQSVCPKLLCVSLVAFLVGVDGLRPVAPRRVRLGEACLSRCNCTEREYQNVGVPAQHKAFSFLTRVFY